MSRRERPPAQLFLRLCPSACRPERGPRGDFCRRDCEVSGFGWGWCLGTSADSVPPRFTLFRFQISSHLLGRSSLLPKPDRIFLLALDGKHWRVGQLERLVYRNHKPIGLHLMCIKRNPQSKKACLLWGAETVGREGRVLSQRMLQRT